MTDYKIKYLKYKKKYLDEISKLNNNKQNNNKQNGGNNCEKIINLEKYKNFTIDPKYLLIFHNNSLFDLMIPSNRLLENSHIFSNQIKNLNNISNQKGSGRCWMFAVLNVIRHKFINNNNLKNDFEFSENYLFFWDKFERVNYTLNLLEKLHKKNEPITSRLMTNILLTPMDDGGCWHMFINLINKYGLVPKSVYPETKHSSSSGNINHMLNKIMVNSFKDIQNNTFNKEKVLNNVFILLVQCFGHPPFTFDWEYVDKKDKYQIKQNCNPFDFYKSTKMNLEDYVFLINDPRNPYNKNYTVDYLNNIEEGIPAKYLNVSMDIIKPLVKKSIDSNESVYFGCDVDKFLLHKNNLLDLEIYNYESILNMNLELNKKEELLYYTSVPNHGMAITGYNKIDNKINRWQIENSWGNTDDKSKKNVTHDIDYKGYYTMTDEWMDKYVYMVVINNKYVSNEIKKKWKEPIDVHYPLWDPFGSLA